MFRGITSISIDEKGRMIMPNLHREALKTTNSFNLVVTIDIEEQCLLLYPVGVWEDIERQLSSLPSFDTAARRVQRLLIGHATELSLDSANRILLPQVLRDYATLSKQAVLVGQGRKIEIWDESIWEKQRKSWLSVGLGKSGQLSQDLQAISL